MNISTNILPMVLPLDALGSYIQGAPQMASEGGQKRSYAAQVGSRPDVHAWLDGCVLGRLVGCDDGCVLGNIYNKIKLQYCNIYNNYMKSITYKHIQVNISEPIPSKMRVFILSGCTSSE